jgi:hypothetical protein
MWLIIIKDIVIYHPCSLNIYSIKASKFTLSAYIRQLLFGEKNTLAEATTNKNLYLKEMGRSYCFLMMLISKSYHHPSTERKLFEILYEVLKEVAKRIMKMPVLMPLLDSELDRLFRSEIFTKKLSIDTGQLAITIFSKSNFSEKDSKSRAGSLSQGSPKKGLLKDLEVHENEEELNDDWKSSVPATHLEWLASKCIKNESANLEDSMNMSRTISSHDSEMNQPVLEKR